MNIPLVKREIVETILEEEASDPLMTYASAFVTELEKLQPELVQFAKEMGIKIPQVSGLTLDKDALAKLEYTILISILVPLKAIYNQIEINEMEQEHAS
jgi:hypothetical protein